MVLGERDDQHQQRGQLRGEGLGGRHADLGAGAREHDEFGFADQGALGDVADGERGQVAGLLREAQRRQRVGRLAGLGNGDEQGIARDDGVPVAVFARHLDAAGDLDDLFDHVTRDRTSVEAGAAGHDMHVLGAPEHIGRGRPEGSLEQAAVGDPFLQRVGDGARLLVDFLEHEVTVLALLGGIGREFAVAHRAVDRVAAAVEHADRLAFHLGDITFLEEHEAAGDGQQGRDVRGDEVLADAEADDHRAALAREDQSFRVGFAGHHQGVGTLELRHRRTDRLEKIADSLEMMVDAVGDDLGVGLAGEGVAELAQFLAQLVVVLDDAVMDDREAVIRHVRVGVAFARDTMGRPARVGDAQAALGRGLVDGVLEDPDLAHRAHALEVAGGVQHGDARGIVAAVFEPAQALHENGNDVALGDGSDNATHAGKTLEMSGATALD